MGAGKMTLASKKQGKVTKSFAKKVLKVVSSTQEKKYFVVLTSVTLSNDVLDHYRITDITQGDSDITRDGDTINLKRIRGNWVLSMADSGTKVAFVRILVYQWVDYIATSTDPSDGQILQSISDQSQSVVSFYNNDTKFNYKILYDKLVAIDNYNRVLTGHFDIKSGFKRKIEFEGGGTAGTNKIWLATSYLPIGSEASRPYFDCSTRISYTDS